MTDRRREASRAARFWSNPEQVPPVAGTDLQRRGGERTVLSCESDEVNIEVDLIGLAWVTQTSASARGRTPTCARLLVSSPKAAHSHIAFKHLKNRDKCTISLWITVHPWVVFNILDVLSWLFWNELWVNHFWLDKDSSVLKVRQRAQNERIRRGDQADPLKQPRSSDREKQAGKNI